VVLAPQAINIAVVAMVREFIAEHRVAQEIIANLYSAPAGTPRMHERYGATNRPTDGSWIVVDYRDTHDGTAPSDIACALRSDGTWLVSDEHHRGRFGDVQHCIDRLAQLSEYAIDADSVRWQGEFMAQCRERGEHDVALPATLSNAKQARNTL